MINSQIGFAGTVAILCLSLLCVKGAMDRSPSHLARPLSSIPKRLGPWIGSDGPELDPQTATVLGATSYLARTYRSSGASLDLFIAYYAQQRAGRSMHSPRNCLPGSGWEVVGLDTVDVTEAGRLHKVNQYVVQKGSQRVIVLYWYQNRERAHASEYLGKAFLVWDAITRRDTAGSIVRITLPEEPRALQQGISFASQVIPAMRACLTDDVAEGRERSGVEQNKNEGRNL